VTETGREALLRRVVDYLAAHGIADISLRRLATEIGTSHRMLIYHFGSREGLLAAVVERVEAEQRDVLAEILASSSDEGSFVERGLRFWQAVTDAALIYGPLFYEVSSHAMQGQPHATALRASLVETWLEPATANWIALGLAPGPARNQARLDLAVARGLLHDLLLTGDRDGVDAAMRRYVQHVFAGPPLSGEGGAADR
jgi:AcrR family transcriptional regulator